MGTGGLVAESHPATVQTLATTDYRYTGANPNNYIKFNNDEKPWRIIGVFDVDDGKGNIEKRIKIIRDSLGEIEWDSNNVNDWTNATGMKLLNEGDYWNRTGSYESNGLTPEAKSQIADAKWYLGGTQNYTTASNGLASHYYEYERGSTVYKGNSKSWVGKVGLMYPSDYGYATSGGSTTNRDACLAKEMYGWDDLSVSDCKINDWLYDNRNFQWTLSPNSGDFLSAFYVDIMAVDYDRVYSTLAFRPSVYLKSDIQITGGTGTESDPYTLPKPPAADVLIGKVGTGGLVADSHPATEQLAATTAYRYTGVNPNNYVTFNNEPWRIIGVFDVDNGTGKLEKRVKIVRNENIGQIFWGGGSNDWANESLMSILNSGDYWNRTGSNASTGLTEQAKQMIDNAKWYLGGTDQNETTNATQFYNYERGTDVYSGNQISWTGMVALMYPSDYGYATAGGTTTNRTACLAKEMYNWGDLSVSDCYSNDWLYDIGISSWFLTPYSGSSDQVFYLSERNAEIAYARETPPYYVKPTVYLKSDIKIAGGTGTESDPYTLSK